MNMIVRMGKLLVQDGSVVSRGKGGARSGWAPWLRALELTLQAKLSESCKYSVRTWLTVPCQLYDIYFHNYQILEVIY